jgi:hypothetical protein
MAAIANVNLASATAPNWLKEAQESLINAANPGGLMGALQNSKYKPGTIKSFLVNSQNNANGFAFIAQGNLQAATNLYAQMASQAFEKRIAERFEAARRQSEPQVNYTPPKELDRIIYFNDGTTIDTELGILTFPDGKQIDTKTGKEYIDEAFIIRMANGAYLDTKNSILHLADGTKIDTITHLTITT